IPVLCCNLLPVVVLINTVDKLWRKAGRASALSLGRMPDREQRAKNKEQNTAFCSQFFVLCSDTLEGGLVLGFSYACSSFSPAASTLRFAPGSRSATNRMSAVVI